jgi:hypothetical protein
MPPKKHRIIQWSSGYTDICAQRHILLCPGDRYAFKDRS